MNAIFSSLLHLTCGLMRVVGYLVGENTNQGEGSVILSEAKDLNKVAGTKHAHTHYTQNSPLNPPDRRPDDFMNAIFSSLLHLTCGPDEGCRLFGW